MPTQNLVFWDVDTQADFMLPGGKLYVPGAEKIIPNLKRLVDAARKGKVFLVSSADAHTPNDEELCQWPPHCLRGSPGQQRIPETLTENYLVIANQVKESPPANLGKFHQVILEKQTLDVFDNPHTEEVLARLGRVAEYFVFGVVTECCVRCATLGLLERGYRVAVVTDAIETLDPTVGHQTLEDFAAKGARLITTDQALGRVDAHLAAQARAR